MTVLEASETSVSDVPGNDRPRFASLAYLLNLVSMVVPPALLAVGAWQRRWVAEDGFITLRVVRQLLTGHGPVFNIGERVEASTSALWTALLAVVDGVVPGRLEVIAVGAGIALSVAGLAMASAGARRLWATDRAQVVVPLGALVIVALPPFWDFSTSGLETGLTFAWLGGAGLLLARAATTTSRQGRWWPAAVVIGLGPLVRPDLVLVAGPILVAFVFLRAQTWRHALRLSAAAAAAPATYQLFRMGYYAALVPNPALAKEASESWWSQGRIYLADFTHPYHLWIPLLAVAAAMAFLPWAGRKADDGRRQQTRIAVALLTPLVGGVVHALYVVRVGGDFMHARLLLPSLFACCMPVMVIRGRSRQLLPALVVAGWALGLATVATPQVPYEGVGPNGIADERATWVALSGRAHPVLAEDYRDYPFWLSGDEARRYFQGGGHGVGFHLDPAVYVFAPARGREGVVESNIGVLGMATGVDVAVWDLKGLADPLAGRVRRTGHGRVGHEKQLDPAWMWARFVADGAPIPPNGPPATAVENARRVLRCPAVQRLLQATSARLTPGRFLRNVVDAAPLYRLRVDNDPALARIRLCE